MILKISDISIHDNKPRKKNKKIISCSLFNIFIKKKKINGNPYKRQNIKKV